MSDLTQDYIDLIASGDKQKIGCVLLAAGSAAAVSGVAVGTLFAPTNVVPVIGTAINATAAGIGAVLGALLAAQKAYNVCGGASTKESLNNVFKTGSIDKTTLESYESLMMKDYGVTTAQARVIAKAAYVFSGENSNSPKVDASYSEKKNAVAYLLDKLSKEGIS